MLTSKDEEPDEALGLALGADDYITKPFSQRLSGRPDQGDSAPQRKRPGRATARRPGRSTVAERVIRGSLELDPSRHRVTWSDGKVVSLTVTEFLILEALAMRPGVVKSRNQLMDAAYSEDVFLDDRTIDSHIKRLRRKFRAVDSGFCGHRYAVWRRLFFLRCLSAENRR